MYIEYIPKIKYYTVKKSKTNWHTIYGRRDRVSLIASWSLFPCDIYIYIYTHCTLTISSGDICVSVYLYIHAPVYIVQPVADYNTRRCVCVCVHTYSGRRSALYLGCLRVVSAQRAIDRKAHVLYTYLSISLWLYFEFFALNRIERVSREFLLQFFIFFLFSRDMHTYLYTIYRSITKLSISYLLMYAYCMHTIPPVYHCWKHANLCIRRVYMIESKMLVYAAKKKIVFDVLLFSLDDDSILCAYNTLSVYETIRDTIYYYTTKTSKIYIYI